MNVPGFVSLRNNEVIGHVLLNEAHSTGDPAEAQFPLKLCYFLENVIAQSVLHSSSPETPGISGVSCSPSSGKCEDCLEKQTRREGPSGP